MGSPGSLAQDEGDWAEAERCFRKAYDLEGGHYDYCLGTALNFLDRFEESLASGGACSALASGPPCSAMLR